MTQRKTYDPEVDLKPYFHPLQPWGQQTTLPNLIEITDPPEALREISYCAKWWDRYDAATMLGGRFPTYCRVFLKSTPMGGGWNGRGILLTNNYPQPKVYSFALCLHEKTEEGHSPNHSRGWHPGHCKHCNMDMSVDSGD